MFFHLLLSRAALLLEMGHVRCRSCSNALRAGVLSNFSHAASLKVVQRRQLDSYVTSFCLTSEHTVCHNQGDTRPCAAQNNAHTAGKKTFNCLPAWKPELVPLARVYAKQGNELS
jgi:hypothetical protein